MSGIVGIVHKAGNPVSPNLLGQMTEWLSFRGPDAQESWTDGPVGLGHALLRTADEAGNERQPASLDQETWIVADARMDARAELVEVLRSRGRNVANSCADSELLLHAYALWGENCLEHVLGDFAFAMWDGRQRKLFCACDPFGIKTLYFAETQKGLVFSNTLDCVRLHPAISDRLNDAAIADFLLFGLNYDTRTTSFEEIRRLPPAHSLCWSAAGFQLKKYWRPPTNGSIRYPRCEEYVEHFRELLANAIDDRLRTNRAGIFLSGGLDSSAVATIACELQKKKYPSLGLHAFTETFQRLPCESDQPAARFAAESLQIPLHSCTVDSAALFEGLEYSDVHFPEPFEDPFSAGLSGQFRMIANNVRVVLSGEGSDNLMEFEMGPHLRRLWHQRHAGQIVFDIVEHARQRFQAPDGLYGPLRRIRRLFSADHAGPRFPEWISPDLVERLNLKDRWRNPLPEIPWKAHPVHPKGYGSLFFPQWRHLFEHENAGVTRQPVEVRYPFLDLRVVNFLLAIPAMPWFFRKHLLREAMRGRLPEKIRTRPKTPLQGDPLLAALRDFDARRIEKIQPTEELSRYANPEALRTIIGECDSEKIALWARLVCLNFWLQSLKRFGYKLSAGGGNAETSGSHG